MSQRAKFTTAFVASLDDVFENFGPISARRMFGGYGIYRDEQGKCMQIAYYTAPAEVFDDPDEAKRWAKRAYAAALRAKRAGGARATR